MMVAASFLETLGQSIEEEQMFLNVELHLIQVEFSVDDDHHLN